MAHDKASTSKIYKIIQITVLDRTDIKMCLSKQDSVHNPFFKSTDVNDQGTTDNQVAIWVKI